MALKILTLDGLEDSRLCDLIAQLLQTIKGVSYAKIDFLSQKLTLEIEGRRTEEVIQDVVSMLKKNIPSVTIKRTEVAREIEKPHVRFPDMSRYDYMREQEEQEEEEEEEELPIEEEKPEEHIASTESAFTMSRNCTRFLAGIGACALFILFANLLSERTPLWSMILSVASLSVSTVFLMMFHPSKIQGSCWGSSLIVLTTSIGVGITSDWIHAAGTVAIYQVAILCATLIYDYMVWNIDNIVDIHPTQVSRQRENTLENVAWNKIMPGDKIVILAGKTIAFPGEILEGESTVNRFLLTGSEDPVAVTVGDKVSCGEKNIKDQLTILVTGLQEKSLAFKLNGLMHDRHLRDTEIMIEVKKKITIFTLISFAVTILGGLLFYIFSEDMKWIPTALALFAITAPCGVAGSVLATQMSCLGAAVRNGIMLKGGNALRNLSKTTMVLLGHAGVLTQGSYRLKDVWTTEGLSKDDILRTAACVEIGSDDPIAKAITEELMSNDNDAKHGELPPVSMREALKGMGVRAMIDKKIVLFGSARYMKEAEITVPPNEAGDICLYMAQRNEYIGALIFEDAIRPGVEEMSKKLRELEVEKIGILTGRDSMVARTAGELIGADVIYAEQSENQKLKTLDILLEEREEKKSLMYVGDEESLDLFIAPCTRTAMGQSAVRMLFESADVMVPSGEPEKVAQAIGYGKGMLNTATTILWMIIIVKTILFICTAAFGLSLLTVSVINGLMIVFIAFKAAQFINQQ